MELLLQCSTLPLGDQNELLDRTLSEWMGETGQVDNILVMGVKV